MLWIRKRGRKYEVEAAPPHVDEAWVTTQPVRRLRLMRELTKRGAHTTDIWDAVSQAKRAGEGGFR